MKKIEDLMIFLVLVLFSAAAMTQDSTPQPQRSLHQGRLGEGLIVGYYGRPGASSLGVLGQHSIDELMPIVQAKADEYDQINGEQKVTPAFHLIYGLATSDPGRDKDYILDLSEKTVMQYISAGQSNGFLVFIDLQLGGKTPLEAIKPVLKYLKHDNVHLAIDPEFEVNGLDIRPGKVIGEISGQEVNQVQSAMADYMAKNGITEDKILIVHMFRKSMVKAGTSVEPHDKINLILNLDGHGSPELKVKIYNNLYNREIAAKIAGGFKLFFQEDKPSMMTPKQVLGLEPVAGNVRIAEPPLYINYQ